MAIRARCQTCWCKNKIHFALLFYIYVVVVVGVGCRSCCHCFFIHLSLLVAFVIKSAAKQNIFIIGQYFFSEKLSFSSEFDFPLMQYSSNLLVITTISSPPFLPVLSSVLRHSIQVILLHRSNLIAKRFPKYEPFPLFCQEYLAS